MKQRRIIVNNDFYNIFQITPPVTDQDIYDAVDKLAGSQVDSLFLMVPAHLGAGRKDFISPDLVRLYDNPEADPCINTMEEMWTAGKDPFQMILDRARSKRLEFFASFRMNDTHYLDAIFNPWVSQFYYDNLDHRVGVPKGRMNTEFDYRKSVIREHMLAAISEAVERYDVDGIELDMTRNCKFFPAGDALTGGAAECAPVMTEFVRQVRGILDQAGKLRKKRILLAATIPCSLLKARQEGLDLPAWARLGMLDVVCMSSPFEADFDRDIHDTRLKLPGVQVYGGCDRNFDYGSRRVVPMETYRAMAMNYLRQGADGIYIYNVMDWTMNMSRLSAEAAKFGGQAPAPTDINLIHEVGEIATLDYLDKLYIVSHGAESADKPYAALPVTVPAKGEVTLRLTVGDDIAKASAAGRIKAIYVQTVSADCAAYDNYTVLLNAIDLSRQYAFMAHADKPQAALLFPEPNRLGALPPLEKVRRHAARAIDLHMGVNFITIRSYREPLTITDVELAVMYRS